MLDKMASFLEAPNRFHTARVLRSSGESKLSRILPQRRGRHYEGSFKLSVAAESLAKLYTEPEYFRLAAFLYRSIGFDGTLSSIHSSIHRDHLIADCLE